MQAKIILMAAGLSMATGCASAGQSRPTNEVAGVRCGGLTDAGAQVATTLAPHNIQRVDALHAQRYFNGQEHAVHVAGAELYVAAEPGVSDAYLERALSCHAAARAGQVQSPNDPLQVAGVHEVRVRSEGQMFQIAITGVDREAGEQILQRAQALAGSASEVHVLQVASTHMPRGSL